MFGVGKARWSGLRRGEWSLPHDEQLVAGGEHGVVRWVHQAATVDEHADEQRIVLVLQHLERMARALVDELRRERHPVQLLALWVREQVGDHGGQAVGASRRREERAGEL